MDKFQKSQFNDVILWLGRPLFWPYLLIHIFNYRGSVRILLIGFTISLFGSTLNSLKFNWNSAFVFLSILCLASIIQVLLKIIGYRNTKYWITKDAVYIQTGVFKPIIQSIQKREIIFIDIKKSSKEQKENAGTVIIDDGETKKKDLEEYKVYKKLIAIKNPEEAIRHL